MINDITRLQRQSLPFGDWSQTNKSRTKIQLVFYLATMEPSERGCLPARTTVGKRIVFKIPKL